LQLVHFHVQFKRANDALTFDFYKNGERLQYASSVELISRSMEMIRALVLLGVVASTWAIFRIPGKENNFTSAHTTIFVS